MKALILLLTLLAHAYAAPVLNKNMAAEGTFVTIWPDHVNPDQFYFAPNFMKIASDGQNNVKFHFTQYRSGSCDTRWSVRRGYCHHKAMITSLMVAGYESQQLAQAQAGILRLRPKARFSAIPFISSKVEFGTTLKEFIDEHDCSPRAGQAADEIPCNITLNKRGISNLMPFLNSGRVLPFKFIYQIAGVIEGANGVYRDEILDYGLTVNLGGDMLIKHAELDVPFLWEE
jgi:hypothetical protein